MKTNFHNKNFALSLAFIMRFTAIWKWPIGVIWICFQHISWCNRSVTGAGEGEGYSSTKINARSRGEMREKSAAISACGDIRPNGRHLGGISY